MSVFHPTVFSQASFSRTYGVILQSSLDYLRLKPWCTTPAHQRWSRYGLWKWLFQERKHGPILIPTMVIYLSFSQQIRPASIPMSDMRGNTTGDSTHSSLVTLLHPIEFTFRLFLRNRFTTTCDRNLELPVSMICLSNSARETEVTLSFAAKSFIDLHYLMSTCSILIPPENLAILVH